MPILSRPRIPTITEARIGNDNVAVRVRVSARARSFRLSVPHGGSPVLTVPRGGRWSDAEAFLHRQSGWLARHLAEAPAAIAFVEGASIPLRGVQHRIVATGRLRGTVEATDLEGEPLLLVPGAPEHLRRRLTDWLKKQALHDLLTRTEAHARQLGVAVRSVKIRAQSSRWGSCSSSGNLSYNWRLVLAPPFVLDYVAAHEVAHLLEMNHSPAFWRVVEKTLPDIARGRTWLKQNGAALMAIDRD